MEPKSNLTEIAVAGIKGLSQLNPYAAGVLSLWDSFNNIKIANRLNFFFHLLDTEMKLNREAFERLDKKVSDLSSNQEANRDAIKEHENRIEACERILEKVAREFDEEKIKKYAIMAINDLLIDESEIPIGQKMDAIENFDHLQSFDIEILKFFSHGTSVEVEKITHRFAVTEIISPLSKLLARGLLIEAPTFKQILSSSDTWQSIFKRKKYTITLSGQDMLRLISSKNKAENHSASNIENNPSFYTDGNNITISITSGLSK